MLVLRNSYQALTKDEHDAITAGMNHPLTWAPMHSKLFRRSTDDVVPFGQVPPHPSQT
jgi:hypothetical protein